MDRTEERLAYQQIMLTERLVKQIGKLNGNLEVLIKDNQQRRHDRAEQRQSIIDNAKEHLLGDKIAKFNDRLVTDISNHDADAVSHDFKDVLLVLKSHPGIKPSIIADYRKSQEAYHKGNANLALHYINMETRQTGC